MPYVAINPGKWLHPPQSVGDGQCVAYVQAASGAPATRFWTQGALVWGNSALDQGTAIATFDADGSYGNHLDGTSHAAIYLSQGVEGITVLDQWIDVRTDSVTGVKVRIPQPVHQRLIRPGPPGVKPVNDATKFYVIS